MKSSKFILATLALMLAFGTAAYAKGPMNGQAVGTSAGAAADTGLTTTTATVTVTQCSQWASPAAQGLQGSVSL